MNKYNTGRIGFGVFYLISSFANFFLTIHNTEFLWIVCLENVRFSIYRDFLELIVIPNEKIIILLIVVLELTMAMLLFSKKIFVKIGLSLGIIWVILISPFLPLADVIGHLVLGLIQATLLMGVYDKTVVEMIQSKINTNQTKFG